MHHIDYDQQAHLNAHTSSLSCGDTAKTELRAHRAAATAAAAEAAHRVLGLVSQLSHTPATPVRLICYQPWDADNTSRSFDHLSTRVLIHTPHSQING